MDNRYSDVKRQVLAGAFMVCTAAAMAQLGISRNPAFVPAADAMLDVSVASLLPGSKMGILIPRMSHAQRIGISAAPATGLIVYQDADFPGPPATYKGYWYYDGTAWVPITPGDGWGLSGNALTNPVTDYVGTFDNQNFRLRTNGTQGVTITAGATPGRVAVNTTTTAEMMEVAGGILINGGAPTNLGGNIRGVPGVFPGTTVHQGYMGAPANAWYQLENVFGERVNQVYSTVTGSCSYPIAAAPNPDLSSGATGDFVTIGTGPVTNGNTINTPYATFWEDHKVQYLYRSTELMAVLPNGSATPTSICFLPEVIEALAFRVPGGAAGQAMQNVEIKMVNTTTTALTTFLTGPMTTVYTAPSFTAVGGNTWNIHTFSTPFGWNGTGNVMVEFCFNNNDWTGNTAISFDNTTYSALYGSYCDACGSLFAPGTCYFASCPNNTPQAGPGVLCTGFSHTGGCQHTAGMSLTTCDGTFQFTGQQGNANMHPQLRLYTKVGGGTTTYFTGDYIYTPHGVMIGDAAWATGGVPPAYKGPGNIVAQNQVWGGALLLSDHVFDSYYDGGVKEVDAAAAKGHQHRSVEEMASFIESNRHLPTVPGRKAWETAGGFSVDGLNTDLWVTVEEQALHIKELNERMELLQKYLIEKRLAELKR